MEHGKVTLASNATYYGAIALYACDSNFELDGVSRRLCQENGTWSSESPACRGIYLNRIKHNKIITLHYSSEIQCKNPDTLTGVLFQVSTHSVGGVAHYTCPKGHTLSGNATRICLQKGSWSGKSPVCIRKLFNCYVSSIVPE